MKYEPAIRFGFFFGVFIIVAVWEVLSPRRRLTTSKTTRWIGNLGVVAIYTTAVRLLFPLLAIDIALKAQEHNWGLLNNWDLPYWVSVLLGVMFLDFIIYLQHVMVHSVPMLWTFHMMHHADLDFDVTTGLRFHPVEIIVSMGIKIATVAFLGPPVIAVLIFEIVLNATSMFNHGNIRLPLNADKVLRRFVVTPDMHRVHHSVIIRETNSNFGFNFPWWDHIFGTYRPQPAMGHEGMTIGLSQFRDKKRLTLPWMLALPFTGDPGSYAINARGKEPDFKNHG